jgi:hypothetical protein
VRQKPSVEVQHAKRPTELTGGLRRGAVLEVGHSLFKRLRNFGGNLVTEEGDLGCSKDALSRIDEDPVSLKLFGKCPQMLFVLFACSRNYKDIVQVGDTEVESPQNVTQEALESLGGIAQTEGHEGKLGNSGLLYVVGMDKDLIVGSHQVDFGRDGATEKLMGVAVDVMDRVTVRNGPGTRRSVVAAGTSIVVLLVYDVDSGSPGTLGAASRTFPPWSAGDRWARYHPDMMNGTVAHLALDVGWAGELRELNEETVDRSAASDGLHAWDL